MMSRGLQVIDGSILEGGGQILRNAAALAAITATSIRVDNIRAGRKKPGLARQHLTGLQLIERLSCGRLVGGSLGSTCVTLEPQRLNPGTFVADTQTAGSCTLLAQAALPCCLFAKPGPNAPTDGPTTTCLELKGGTDADMAPPVSYLQEVLAPLLLSQLGVRVGVTLARRGFFPAGGGELRLSVPALAPGAVLPPVALADPGEVASIKINAFAAGNVPLSRASDMARAALKALQAALGSGVAIEHQAIQETRQTAMGDGAGLSIVAVTTTGCILGANGRLERSGTPEAVGKSVALELLDPLQRGACVDQWGQDQMIIFMALGAGTSRMLCTELTLHTRTAIQIAEQLLLAKFTVTQLPAAAPAAAAGTAGGESPAAEGLWLVECEGAAVANV